MLEEVLDLLLGFRRPKFAFNLDTLSVTDLPTPSLLSFSMSSRGFPCLPAVKAGDEVSPGQFLARDGDREVLACPVKGKVVSVVSAPQIRGGQEVEAVLIEPAADTSPKVFSELDPKKASPEELIERIERAGILTDAASPRPLSELIGPGSGTKTVIVSAADRDALQCQSVQAFRDRSEDACRAASMLARMAGADVRLAIAGPLAADAKKICDRFQITVLSLPGYYPEGLEPLVALRAGGGESVKVVNVETALAALDAVEKGQVQDRKIVTFIGPAGQVRTNYRVTLGTRLKDLFAAAGLNPRDEDKVIMGGPLKGYAQYSLDAAVDQGVDAVTMIAREEQVKWSDEPCINDGACVAVCPVKLQPQLIGRYAEFGLFDRTEDLGVENCIECGLCAAVCTGRRPLLQWIRLAKHEVWKSRAAEKVEQTAACEDAGREAGASGQ